MALLLLAGALSACDRQSQSPSQANATQSAAEANGGKRAVSDGEFNFTVDRSKAGTAIPDLAFAAPDGTKTTLARFVGKPILLNLWATWCTPCVAEMPTLDAIADRYAARGLQIVTVSQDSQGQKIVAPFIEKRGFKHLKPWIDTENTLGFHYATGMLPTSVLYDAKGKEIARVTGAMDWQGKEASALIEEAL